jgi:hypothetical protein
MFVETDEIRIRAGFESSLKIYVSPTKPIGPGGP